MRIAIIGGTGREGRGLALRWARAGHEVAVGSRDAERARARAAELSGEGLGTGTGQGQGQGKIGGGDNAWAVAQSEVAVLTVPYGAHAETLRGLKEVLIGRILIDLTVPLKPPKISEVHLPEGQAAALEAQAILGEGTQVAAALHHVSSAHLSDAEHAVEGDVLVCGDSAEAKAAAIALVGDLGARALDAGPLRNAIALEALTPVLLGLNKRYRGNSSIRFLGI